MRFLSGYSGWFAAGMALCAAGLTVAATDQPYIGQDTREIASLSARDQEDLREGRGWGFALSAELNGYPGPTHILELADELDLTADQRARVTEIFEAMNVQARVLGAAYIEAEAAIDAAFEEKSMTPEALATLTGHAGRLRAELRAVHLAAHLEAAPVLTRHQTMIYNRARGYAGGHGQSGHSHD